VSRGYRGIMASERPPKPSNAAREAARNTSPKNRTEKAGAGESVRSAGTRRVQPVRSTTEKSGRGVGGTLDKTGRAAGSRARDPGETAKKTAKATRSGGEGVANTVAKRSTDMATGVTTPSRAPAWLGAGVAGLAAGGLALRRRRRRRRAAEDVGSGAESRPERLPPSARPPRGEWLEPRGGTSWAPRRCERWAMACPAPGPLCVPGGRASGATPRAGRPWQFVGGRRARARRAGPRLRAARPRR
jgi:LPXTG-motif cell wall-anchored protein